MKHIIGIILKVIVGIYVAAMTLIGTFAVVVNEFGWYEVHGCECGNIKSKFKGPVAFMNKWYK